MSKKKTANGKRTPKFVANEKLQPLIDWCEKTRGETGKGIAEVMRRYEDVTGEGKPRCEFQRWLATNEKERVQCRLGIGLILISIGDVLIAETKG